MWVGGKKSNAFTGQPKLDLSKLTVLVDNSRFVRVTGSCGFADRHLSDNGVWTWATAFLSSVINQKNAGLTCSLFWSLFMTHYGHYARDREYAEAVKERYETEVAEIEHLNVENLQTSAERAAYIGPRKKAAASKARSSAVTLATLTLARWLPGCISKVVGLAWPRPYFFKIAMRPIKAPSNPVKIPKIPPRTFSHDSGIARRSVRSFRIEVRNSVRALAVKNLFGGLAASVPSFFVIVRRCGQVKPSGLTH